MAIAMTLLVLPLVDQVGAVEVAGLAGVSREHAHLFISFLISFLVIYVFWSPHEQPSRWSTR